MLGIGLRTIAKGQSSVLLIDIEKLRVRLTMESPLPWIHLSLSSVEPQTTHIAVTRTKNDDFCNIQSGEREVKVMRLSFVILVKILGQCHHN